MNNLTKSNHRGQRRTLVFIATLIAFAILMVGIGPLKNVPVDSASAPMQAMASRDQYTFSRASYYTSYLPLVAKQSSGRAVGPDKTPTPFPLCTLTPTPAIPHSTSLPTPTSSRPDCSLYFVSSFPPDIDGSTVTFNWKPAYDYGYHIQVADNQAFVAPTVDAKVDSTTYSYTTDLEDGVWYWRIRLDALIRCNVGQVMHPSGEIWSFVTSFSVGGSVTPTVTPTATHDIEALILAQVGERIPMCSADNSFLHVAPPYYYLTCAVGSGHFAEITIKRYDTPLDAQSAFAAAYGDQDQGFHSHPAVEWRCFTNSYSNCSYSRCLRPDDLTTGMLHRNHCWQADRWNICVHAFDDTAIEIAPDPLEVSEVVYQVFVEQSLLSDEQ